MSNAIEQAQMVQTVKQVLCSTVNWWAYYLSSSKIILPSASSLTLGATDAPSASSASVSSALGSLLFCGELVLAWEPSSPGCLCSKSLSLWKKKQPQISNNSNNNYSWGLISSHLEMLSRGYTSDFLFAMAMWFFWKQLRSQHMVKIMWPPLCKSCNGNSWNSCRKKSQEIFTHVATTVRWQHNNLKKKLHHFCRQKAHM